MSSLALENKQVYKWRNNLCLTPFTVFPLALLDFHLNSLSSLTLTPSLSLQLYLLQPHWALISSLSQVLLILQSSHILGFLPGMLFLSHAFFRAEPASSGGFPYLPKLGKSPASHDLVLQYTPTMTCWACIFYPTLLATREHELHLLCSVPWAKHPAHCMQTL